ncbi:allantoinase AllB [Paenibacillus sp. IB182496]|uniref:Allantoinase n=1 Tax=Paenibacillus sabuli TaxID=2772509 RepID=A0A927BY61_9BACL|nr:allantoinase AllB [Paenibacillus sabuli]MBD2848527.1 allantoinase AllB [Paenibacillus sabuli]
MHTQQAQWDLIVRGGRVVLADAVQTLDIGIRDGRIAALGALPEDGSPALAADGLIVMPGMIDAHVHLNEPGMGHWEGFASGSAALAAGGCTTYVDMPLNGIPPTVTTDALTRKLEAARGASHIDYALWGGLVPGNLQELEALAEAGVAGFKAFMSSPGDPGEEAFREVDDLTLLEGMRILARLGRVLALHAESEPLTASLATAMRAAGRTGAAGYTASRPPVAELEAVRRALFYAEQTGCALHFVHISTAAAAEAIMAARRAGADVTLETCPHYLMLTEQTLLTRGAVAKCAPPLRSAEERERLWALTAQGAFDFIASDHSPCPLELKQGATIMDAWGGIAGAQSSLELIVGEGHLARGLPLPLLARLLATGPARRLGLAPRKGEIRLGADADLALVDPNRPYRLTAAHLLQRHRHSPYIGDTMRCKVTATLSRGRLVYTAEEGIRGAAAGMWMRPIQT